MLFIKNYELRVLRELGFSFLLSFCSIHRLGKHKTLAALFRIKCDAEIKFEIQF